MFCKYCGNQIKDDALFCPKCGKRVDGQTAAQNATPTEQTAATNNTNYAQTAQNAASAAQAQATAAYNAGYAQAAQENVADEDEKLMRAYCHDKVYFIDTFRRIKQTGKNSWNWAAFFLTAYYLCYRKMWGWGILFWSISTALSLVSVPSQGIALLIVLAVNIAAGYLANKLYYDRYEKILGECKLLHPTFEARRNYMYGKGGPSAGAVVLIIVLLVAYIGFLALIGAVIGGMF